MAFNFFGKKEVEAKKLPKTPLTEIGEKDALPEAPKALGASQGAFQVIKNFYVSEKSARLMAMNQYVFKVADSADKQSVKKHISALYKVRITNVQMLNMPSKVRNIGKFSGKKAGFQKAIVTLAKGDVIEQAKP